MSTQSPPAPGCCRRWPSSVAPATYFPALFSRAERDDSMLFKFAAGESIAHLNYRIALGSVRIQLARSVNWYSSSVAGGG